ncbi:MAG: hypothetical protein J3R72DRAFT_427799 [Linnemannia gamsii]|nr:MAG: hypothetical protein J3R72DRAFT_427799 [Linnemannia gamsii]
MVSRVYLPNGHKAIIANFAAKADGTRYESTFMVHNRQFRCVVQQVDAASPFPVTSAVFVIESISQVIPGKTAEYIESNVDVFYGDMTVNVSVFPLGPVKPN